MDIYGLPAAGVQAHLVILPAGSPIQVEDPPPTDAYGVAVGYVGCNQAGTCGVVQVQVGDVTLLAQPQVCFNPPGR